MLITKRNGAQVEFDGSKIYDAVEKAAKATGEGVDVSEVVAVVLANSEDGVHVEAVQDKVENSLMRLGYYATARAYITYRNERAHVRNQNNPQYKHLDAIRKRALSTITDNANVNGQAPMGAMLLAGASATKDYVLNCVVHPEHAYAHRSGYIHIHDLDFYLWTSTCAQIDLHELFSGGFYIDNCLIREPRSVTTAALLTCIALQSNQNDQHGGQSIPAIDEYLAPYVRVSYEKHLKRAVNLAEALGDTDEKILSDWAWDETVTETMQSMQAIVYNLNTMHSRAGGQVPFTSLNYGTDTSREGRLIIEGLLKATLEGLGKGETPTFPIQVFKVKAGVSRYPGDPNYDLFMKACECSGKRLFPTYAFLDAPFNQGYGTEVAYMGCRTRVMANVYNPEFTGAAGRGNLSFTSINLPRLAYIHRNEELFFEELGKLMDVVFDQLYERMLVQTHQPRANLSFLIGNNVFKGASDPDASLFDIYCDGTLSVGFVGLAETLIALCGKHHGESSEAQELGLKIVGFMRGKCDKKAAETKLNYTLLATPAESLAGRFKQLDGVMEINITDKEYYTNSFHVPVWHKLTVAEKIAIEAPYHELTNAGHISYVELDGDPDANREVIPKIVEFMAQSGIGYGAINVPVDYDPVCGYSGIINDICPGCGRKVPN
jgi:ribonucleoside-triphosphate reductase